jgi:hypothetical protein
MSHQTLMIGTEIVPETSVIFNQLTRLITREDFINFGRCENLRLYSKLYFAHIKMFYTYSAVVFIVHAINIRLKFQYYLYCDMRPNS